MAYTTSEIIGWAKQSQILALIGEAKKKQTAGGKIDEDLHIKLYVERKSLEWIYAQNPSDAGIFKQANYVFSLCGEYGLQSMASGGCVAPSISVQPTNQTPILGGSCTFTVVASGSNLNYQWQFNDSNLIGKIDSSLTLSNVSSGNVGNYRCVITNACGNAITNEAALNIGSGDATGYYYYGDTDYSAQLQMGIDMVPWVGTFPIVNGQPLSVPFPPGAADNKYNITKYPFMQGTKTAYDNHIPVVGSIPDAVYNDVLTFSNFSYIYSRVAMSLNSSFPMIFT